jgi:hypothetical protein
LVSNIKTVSPAYMYNIIIILKKKKVEFFYNFVRQVTPITFSWHFQNIFLIVQVMDRHNAKRSGDKVYPYRTPFSQTKIFWIMIIVWYSRFTTIIHVQINTNI